MPKTKIDIPDSFVTSPKTENFLRLLISSSNEKFSGALQILDIVTQLVAERIGAPFCATLYRRSDDSCHRFISIEDVAEIQSENLPLIEKFVEDNFGNATSALCGRYLDLNDPDIVSGELIDFAFNKGLIQVFCYKFELSLDESVFILCLLDNNERTVIGSALRVCEFGAQQLRVAFNFVKLETKQIAQGAFVSGVMKLSGVVFANGNSLETLERLRECVLSFPIVGRVEHICMLANPEKFAEIELEFGKPPDRSFGVKREKEGIDDAPCFVRENGEVVAALGDSLNDSCYFVISPVAGQSFSQHDIQLLELFATHLSVVIANHAHVLQERKTNEDLRAAQIRVMEAEAMAALGDMASGVAHEFNNVLGGITGRLEILKHSHSEPGLLSAFDEMATLATRGADQVRRLQQFAVSARPSDLATIDLGQVMAEYLEASHEWVSIARSREIEVKFSTSPDDPANIQGTQTDIFTLMDSLVTNAVEAAGYGGIVHIELTARNNRAILSVADPGPGVPVSIKNKIFNPFFTTKREQGAGLGLSAAQGIVAKLGGIIETSPNLSGHGTVFCASFPVVDPIEMVPDEPVESATTERSLNIMVVDDDEHIRGVLSDMLTLIGQESHRFPSAQKALDAFEAGKYDLVITDLGMPGMTGLELTTRLKKIQPDIPVALVTGWGAQLAEDDILSKGIFEIVPKPFHLEDIRSLVTHVTG